MKLEDLAAGIHDLFFRTLPNVKECSGPDYFHPKKSLGDNIVELVLSAGIPHGLYSREKSLKVIGDVIEYGGRTDHEGFFRRLLDYLAREGVEITQIVYDAEGRRIFGPYILINYPSKPQLDELAPKIRGKEYVALSLTLPQDEQ